MARLSAEMSIVKRPAAASKVGDGHAGAVQRDAVAQLHVVEVAGRHLDLEPLAVGRIRTQRCDGGDAAEAADDAE